MQSKTRTRAKNQIFVLGAGSLGLFTQYHFQKNGLQSILLGRKNTKEHFKNNKLHVSGMLEDAINIDCDTLEDLPAEKVTDDSVIFVLCKADQVEPILINLNERLGAKCACTLVLCQNGIGVFDLASALTAATAFKLVRLHYWLGTERKAIGEVKIAGVYKFDLSAEKENKDAMSVVESILGVTGITIEKGFDPHLSEWKKALWNIAVNGLCSIADKPNGAILDYPELFALSKTLVQEACEVAKLGGIELTQSDIDQVFRSLSQTRANTNATLQDLRVGKASEIDYFNGAVVKYARSHGQKAPFNETITNLVLYLERSRSRIK